MSDNAGYKVIVSGLVQGVCFRFSTAQQARKLNIVGYAKNLSDGSVEVKMFGEAQQLLSLIEFVKHGPENAVVKSTQIESIPYQAATGFVCC